MRELDRGVQTFIQSAVLLSVLLSLSSGLAAGGPPDSEFRKVVIDPTPHDPMQLSIAHDGRVFYVERGGALKVWKPTTGTSQIAGIIGVEFAREDGLLGLALDPDFQENQWIYLFYSPPGPTPVQYVSRFQLNGDNLDLGSEKVLLIIPVQRETCCHSGGGLGFGQGGLLYIGVGDNTNPFESSGYTPIDERPNRSSWDAQRTSGNANDLRGKILRIKPERNGTYSVPAGNLFPPGTANTRPEIYTMGNRNPFRFSVDPETGWLYWGEVGPDADHDDPVRGVRGYDEFNQARSAGNYGWPYFIADNKAYRDFDFASLNSGFEFDAISPQNGSPNNTGLLDLPQARPAWIWYPYGHSTEFPQFDGGAGRTAMAGPVYHFQNSPGVSDVCLPSYYDKSLFLFEWSRNLLREVRLNETGDIESISPFLPSFRFVRPIDLKIGPDGVLYMIEWGTEFLGGNTNAKIVRVEYVGGNFDETTVQSAADLSGPFGNEPGVEYDLSAGVATVNMPSTTRFFRLVGRTNSQIIGFRPVGSTLQLRYAN